MSTPTIARRSPHHPGVNRLVLGLLRSPLHRLASGGLCELRYRTPSTGRLVTLPVGYARTGDRLVVLVGQAESKRWWRAFVRPHPVEVRLGGELRMGVGQVVDPNHPATAAARNAYLRRHRVTIRATDRLLLVDL